RRDEVAALTTTLAGLRAENAELRRAAVAGHEAERPTTIPSQVVPIAEALAARAINSANGSAGANGHANGKAAALNGNGGGNGGAGANGHANGKVAAANGNGSPADGAGQKPPTLAAPVSLRARLRALQRAGTRH